MKLARLLLPLCVGTAALAAACGSPPLVNEEDIGPPRSGASGAGAGGSDAGAAGASAGAAGTAGGSAGAAAFACSPDESLFWGAPVDAANACLDTTALVVVGCGSSGGATGERCVRRKSDGVAYWVMLNGVPRYDASLWEPCGSPLGAPEQAPPICSTRTCAQPAPAFCAPEATIELFSCGSPISAYDEGCCLRAACETGADCPSDQECRAFDVPTGVCTARADATSCDCAGILMTLQEMRCGPLPSG